MTSILKMNLNILKVDDSVTKTDIEYLAEIKNKYLNLDIESMIDISVSHNGEICYVDANNTDYQGPTGETWTGAYVQLQDCLDKLALDGGEIWVSAGVYTPSKIPNWKQNAGHRGPKERSFILYDNIRVYGGFDGTETSPSQRDFAANPTYLSGKLTLQILRM